jgi:hypothetical protein
VPWQIPSLASGEIFATVEHTVVIRGTYPEEPGMGHWSWRLKTWPALVVVCLAGCSKEQFSQAVNKSVEQVQQKVTQTVETVKEQANLAGSLELTLDQPIKTGRCYASLFQLSEGRPSVFQITSYQSTTDENFPSAMLRAEISQTTLTALVGQKVSAQVYLQSVANGPIWHTQHDQPVELSITAADDKSVSGEVVSGKVINTDSGQSVDVKGKFTAAVR